MSFRTKLLLAMAFIVAGVSLAVLLITQRRVEENYARMFRNQYERQIDYFTTMQESRLGAVKEQCLKLSQSVRLLAALDSDLSADEERKNLYQVATDELQLRDVSGGAAGSARRPSTTPLQGLRATTFRILDATGRVVQLPDTLASRQSAQLFRRQLENKLGLIRDVLASNERQQVGYLDMESDSPEPAAGRLAVRRAQPRPREQQGGDGAMVLQEVVVTRVVDPVGEQTRGWIVLAFQIRDLVPLPRGDGTNASAVASEILRAGIILDDKCYANTNSISESLGEMIVQSVSNHVHSTKLQRDDFTTLAGGEHFRVFYELMNERSAFPRAYQVCLFSMEEAQREQSELRWKILGSAAIALTVGLALCLFLSHGLSAPIRGLVAGTGEIQRGNFQVRVPVRSRDELGRLTASFNEMAEGLAQKEKYRTVLNMVADEKIAQQLIHGELALGGELREITVLFCDIRGFTALTQNMPPQEIIEMLNEHMTALTRVVKEHHGVLDKFVGDLLMAIFGAPVSHGDDALNAGRCALHLHEVREELNRTSRHKLEMGIGLATGTVVAGCMGSEDRLNYTVLGERVNLASRLCSQARAGEILVDDNSREKFAGILFGEPLGEIQLKGFSQPVQVFRMCRKRNGEGK